MLPMYKRIIQVWSELTQNTPQTANQIRNEFLWNNRFILINHKSVWWRNWHDQGLNRTENILTPDGAFVPYNDLAQKHIIDYRSYISLLDAISKDWKKILKSTRTPEQITIAEQSVLIEKAVHRDIYNLFRNEIADAPTVEKKQLKNASQLILTLY